MKKKAMEEEDARNLWVRKATDAKTTQIQSTLSVFLFNFFLFFYFFSVKFSHHFLLFSSQSSIFIGFFSNSLLSRIVEEGRTIQMNFIFFFVFGLI